MSRLEISDTALWRRIVEETEARRPLVAATVVRETGSVPRRTGAKMLFFADSSTAGSVGGGLFESLVHRDAQEALTQRHSTTKTYSFNPVGSAPNAFGAVCGGKAEVFIEVITPPDRLLIVGGGHCGRALAKVASLLDFDIVVVDDRADYARPEDFLYPNVSQTLCTAPDFSDIPVPDENTYVALISKGYLSDEAALRRILDTPAAYIGMIGSKRKRDIVYDNLRKDGIPEEKLERIFAPIGIEIGAETPEEIAISILAEIVRVRAKNRTL